MIWELPTDRSKHRDYIYRMLIASGLTQTQLAQKSGVNYSMINRYLGNKSNIRDRTLAKIYHVLKKELDNG